LWYFCYCMCCNVVRVGEWAIDVNKTASAAISLVFSLQFKKVLDYALASSSVLLMRWSGLRDHHLEPINLF
jgi:hypothetical protein